MQGENQFTKEQTMIDLLSSQKHLTSMYNTYCCEAATGTLRSSLLSILQDEHRIVEEIFNEMNVRGLYPVQRAEEKKIADAKNKFASTVTV
jgi:spore coat protein CotF